MSAALLLAEQAGLHHGGGERQGGVVAGDVQRGDGEQVPERPAGPLGLAVGGEPVTETLRVGRRVGRVEARAWRGRGGKPGPFGQGKKRIPGQRGQHMQGAGERGPAEPAPCLVRGPGRSRRSGPAAGRARSCRAGRAGRGRRVQQPRKTCWPVSTTRPSRVNEQVAPPSLGLASSRVTSAPASASAIAAVMPASPPPITTTRAAGLIRDPPGQGLGRDHGLLACRQGHPAAQHRRGLGRDPVQQPRGRCPPSRRCRRRCGGRAWRSSRRPVAYQSRARSASNSTSLAKPAAGTG